MTPGSEWSIVRNLSGEQGRVPSSYLQQTGTTVFYLKLERTTESSKVKDESNKKQTVNELANYLKGSYLTDHFEYFYVDHKYNNELYLYMKIQLFMMLILKIILYCYKCFTNCSTS